METLLLPEAQVHTGMIVALALVDTGQPEVDEHGPLLFKALMGGIPMRKKMYILKGRPSLFQQTPEGWKAEMLTDQPLDINPVQGMEGFDERVRFLPIYTFTPQTAPHNMEFVVYLDGQRLKYPSGRNNVYVSTDNAGTFSSHNGYEYEFWLQKYELPENAVLVPVKRIEIIEVPHAPSIVYKGPESSWTTIAAVLAKEASMFGIRIFDVHRGFPNHKRREYLHFGLEGAMVERNRKKFTEQVLGKGLGGYTFMSHCPHCWQTITREQSL